MPQNLLYPHSSSNTASDSASTAGARPFEVVADPYIFGQPLDAAVERFPALVAVRGYSSSIQYGPLPVLVAICGMYLQDNGLFDALNRITLDLHTNNVQV